MHHDERKKAPFFGREKRIRRAHFSCIVHYWFVTLGCNHFEPFYYADEKEGQGEEKRDFPFFVLTLRTLSIETAERDFYIKSTNGALNLGLNMIMRKIRIKGKAFCVHSC